MAKDRGYKELFEGKGIDELLDMQKDLSDYINEERELLEKEKEIAIREKLVIGNMIEIMDGKGKDAKKVKARIIIMTEKGITAVLPDGKKINRRYRKLTL